MKKLEAKSHGKKQNTYLKISHLTREKQALFDGPSKHRKKNQHLRQAHLQNVDFPRKNIFTSNHWHGFQLNSLNRNEGKPKISATTLASGKLSGSAISMLSEGFDWYKIVTWRVSSLLWF